MSRLLLSIEQAEGGKAGSVWRCWDCSCNTALVIQALSLPRYGWADERHELEETMIDGTLHIETTNPNSQPTGDARG